jgi:dUTP pyrophosphatase
MVKRGDRVAQLILEKISMVDITEVDELADTKRGKNGFGSTGI